MKTPLKIVIVRYEVLSSSQNAPDNAGGDIDKYLDNFCAWQEKRLKQETRSKRWDHAIMLTGLDLYKEMEDGRKNKKVLGLAWVNGMCKPHYSCTLNEGKSFEAAFVIAHEMGHSLGILHDGRNNNCDGNRFIMSERTGPGKIHWSACSNAYLEAFLRKGHGSCLENAAIPRAELDFAKTNRLAGEQYSPDLQCKLALGPLYRAYHSSAQPYNDICRELWCYYGGWVTPAHPALEGSACGEANHKCFQGTCEDRKETQQSPATTERTREQINFSKSSNKRRVTVVRPLRTRNRKRSGKVLRESSLKNLASQSNAQYTPKKAILPPRNKSVIEHIRGVFRTLSDGVESFFSKLG
ncbi:disintegrin and metalloproteinase with thrombospondin motifs 7-like protein 1 [Dinothrombium tinctorium]|uniref:Disintegrin and metalloproteinase with thrombospondin motifs 7-like protein 1 n=1 Tax=Dinothrombium tinctorium TaxID=1965070 RepID=A0A3S3RQF5_9ACAR|nr:disintegrin and metalloproteinase with thrombospondin motifs 7-like protein 1 [Dinothrombium tinctorium]RWS03449.1 disintegrin and metalloproteinase with thrombospondin motifs 7-like protein 1 [Dinothrombium tinctorium]